MLVRFSLRTLLRSSRLGLGLGLGFGLALLSACVTAEPSSPAVAPTDEPEPRGPAVESATPAATLERHEVRVDDHPLTVWSKVAADPWGVVVLVHGRTWSARPDFDLQVSGEDTVATRSLMDLLVAEGLTTYAIDQRGYGDTPRDESGWLTPDRAVADLAGVLRWVGSRHTKLPRPTVLGWSLGSLTSQLTAQRHPGLLSTLVLYGYPRRPGQEYLPDLDPNALPSRTPTTAEGAAEDFIIPGTISPAAVDAFVQAALASDPVRTDWRAADQWSALDPAAVHTPTLVIHGERDPYAVITHQAELFVQLGHADRSWVIVPNGDHAAHLEDCGPRFVEAVVAHAKRAR